LKARFRGLRIGQTLRNISSLSPNRPKRDPDERTALLRQERGEEYETDDDDSLEEEIERQFGAYPARLLNYHWWLWSFWEPMCLLCCSVHEDWMYE